MNMTITERIAKHRQAEAKIEDRSILPTKCSDCLEPLKFNFLMKYTGHSKKVQAWHVKCYEDNMLIGLATEIAKIKKMTNNIIGVIIDGS